jgi:hypothetical protein
LFIFHAPVTRSRSAKFTLRVPKAFLTVPEQGCLPSGSHPEEVEDGVRVSEISLAYEYLDNTY